LKPLEDVQTKTLDICASCGKRKNVGRTGSFTQFIFRSDLCTCDRKDFSKSGDHFSPIHPSLYHAYQEIEEEIEPDPNLSVDDNSFPTERYSPLKKIGMGAEGSVYVCRDEHLRKLVAVKVLRLLSADQLVAFQHEAKILSRLEHPNIARILDFGATAGGTPYMVLEYSSGISLRSDIDANGALEIEDAVDIFLQLCDALIYCHEHGVLHRDLKPENILYSRKPEGRVVKLIDFGIALVVDQEKTTTLDGRVIAGTPAYMAPDQVHGHKYDARSEIYSLGCVMFEALTKRPPFFGEVALGILASHAKEKPPLLEEAANRLFPHSIQDFVSVCLEKRPQDRFQSMQEVKEDLLKSKELDTQFVITQEQPAFVPPPPPKRSLSPFIFVLCIVVFCGAGILIIGLDEQEIKLLEKTDGRATGGTMDLSIYPGHHVDVFSIRKVYSPDSGYERKIINANGIIRDSDLAKLAARTDLEQGDLRLANFDDMTNRQDLISSKGYRSISKMPLACLEMPYSSLRDKDMEGISKMPLLLSLEISGTTVGDAGLKFLENNDSIVELRIARTDVTDEGAKYLATMKRLRRLIMHGNKIGDRSLQYLCNAPQLDTLNVSETHVTDAGLAYLSKVHRLRSLMLASTSVTEKGIKSLSANRNMQCLNVDSNKAINDASIALIAKQFPRIDDLNISDTSITGKGLKDVGKLTNLRTLNICALGLKDADMEPVFKLKELRMLSLMLNDISDVTLEKLCELPRLREVEIHNCHLVTTKGLEKLRKAGKDAQAIHAVGQEQANEMVNSFFD